MKGVIHVCNIPNPYPCLYSNDNIMNNTGNMNPVPYFENVPDFWNQLPNQYLPHMEQSKPCNPLILKDYGPKPFAIDIDKAAKENNNFRLALWTGKYLQVTLMSINVGDEIGLEIHPDLDQFIRIEEGQGLVKMGDSKNCPDFEANVREDYAFVIPAGKWHNLINTGNKPLKLYSIYAPPQHPFGTVHKTKADAHAAEENHSLL